MLQPPTGGAELLAWQTRLETALDATLEREFTDGLRTIRSLALGRSLTQAAARQEWVSAVDRSLAKLELPVSEPAVARLRDELLALALGDEAYRAVETVDTLSRATLTRPDPEEYLEALEEVLGLTTPTAALVAAGGVRERLRKRVLDWMRPAKSDGLTWRSQIRRGVRTGFTGLTGSLVMARLAATGARTKKWVTKHDDRVRSTHEAADGQTVPLNAPFSVGGQMLMYPGDARASVGETINCRCVMVAGDDTQEIQ